MKKTTLVHLALGLFLILSSLAQTPISVAAQDDLYPDPSELYSREELAQMLAPIALYPDALLSQVLMASTYPIEVIEADRWVRRNSWLNGDALDRALLDKDWDPSVKALCHFPSILALMSERIAETTDLGNAFLAQETEVMEVVQELRTRAYAEGNLATTDRQQVIVEKETIIIQPADPRVIYVPYYDPFYVYGPWWYPAYPPWYWYPPGVTTVVGVSYWPVYRFGFAFGSWSWFDWHHHVIHIDVHKRPKYVRHDRWPDKPGRWHHAPDHRRGVAYRDQSSAEKYRQFPHHSRDVRDDGGGIPERRDLDRDRGRREDGRTGIDRYRRGDNRPDLDRDRRERERLERDRQVRDQAAGGDRQVRGPTRSDRPHQEGEPPERDRQRQIREQAERNRQERANIDGDRQGRERVERDRQTGAQTDLNRQTRERLERERQSREQAERGRQERARIERDRQERERVDRERQGREQAERDRQVRQRSDQDRRAQERAVREQQGRDKVFNQAEDGRRQGLSGERGRDSRESRGEDLRDRGRPGGDDRGGRQRGEEGRTQRGGRGGGGKSSFHRLRRFSQSNLENTRLPYFDFVAGFRNDPKIKVLSAKSADEKNRLQVYSFRSTSSTSMRAACQAG